MIISIPLAEGMPRVRLSRQRSVRIIVILIGAIAGAAAIAGSTKAGISENAARSPNIVLIIADDLGYGDLGCYGQEWIKTPHIDRLAAEGIRFTQFYSGNAVCAPSRCCLLTAKHPGHAYVRDNGNPPGRTTDESQEIFPGQHPIPAGEVTIAEVLRKRRYATAAVGKWGLGYEGSSGDPNAQGFDLFYGYYCQGHAHNHYPRFLWRNGVREAQPGNSRELTGQTYSQDQFTQTALDFIRRHKDGPFFLYLPFTIPHLSIQVPETSLAQYKGAIPETDYEHKGYLKHPTPHAGYAAMISHLDDGVGQIAALISELGLDQSTLIVFSSDNGPTHGRIGGADSEFFHSAGPFRGLKGSLYEGGIRVPLLARWPGKIPPGAVSDHVGAFWDVLPTLAELTGAEVVGADPPTGLDGISFADTLLGRGDRQREHEYLYWEFPGYGGWQAVRLRNWKAVRHDMVRKDNPDPLRIELFDLATDIGETTDVAADHSDVVAKVQQIMNDEHSQSELFPLRPIEQP